jgi:hypothetical protein
MAKINYSGYRFPAEIIQQAIWLYLRFTAVGARDGVAGDRIPGGVCPFNL